MFRPTITDMQNNYGGDFYNIYLIQSLYKGNNKRGQATEGRSISFVVAAESRQLCVLA